MTLLLRGLRVFHSHRTMMVVAAALATTACSGGSSVTGTTPIQPVVPTAGWLTLQLDTPRSDDGAVQLLVSGPGIDSIRVSGYDGYAAVVNGEANLLVTGSVVSGSIGQLRVPDLARASEYHVSVVAAAARSSYLLQDLTGYRVALVR